MATAAPPTSTGSGPTPVSTGPRPDRPWLVQLYGTAVGKKYAMAITGIVGLGYIFAHMVGNLKVYFGAESINTYSEWLREGLFYPLLPHTWMLWILRITLIVALVVHLHAAWALTVMNRRARPVAYQSRRDFVVADFAARTMRWTGVIVLLFILYHLADLTWGVEAVNPAFERGAVHANLVASLSRPVVAGFYLLANLALGVHIYHGIWSLFQSMGWNNRTFNKYRRSLAVAFTVVVIGGNLSFPIAILLGIVG